MADETGAVFPDKTSVVVDNVPVISPNGSVTNLTAMVTAIGNLVVIFAQQLGAPLDNKSVVALVTAFNIVAAVVVWVRNTYFRNSVTSSSLDPEMKMSMRRVP